LSPRAALQGIVAAVVGPVVDLGFAGPSLFLHSGVLAGLGRPTLLPSLLDAAVLLRPLSFFRDGPGAPHPLPRFGRYFLSLPSRSGPSSSLPLGLRAALPPRGPARRAAAAPRGLLALSALLKAFSNPLFIELRQLASGGLVRSVALSWTDGLSTLKTAALLLFQPLQAQVGRICLGRVFNVLAGVVDSYLEVHAHARFARGRFSAQKQRRPLRFSASTRQLAPAPSETRSQLPLLRLGHRAHLNAAAASSPPSRRRLLVRAAGKHLGRLASWDRLRRGGLLVSLLKQFCGAPLALPEELFILSLSRGAGPAMEGGRAGEVEREAGAAQAVPGWAALYAPTRAIAQAL